MIDWVKCVHYHCYLFEIKKKNFKYIYEGTFKNFHSPSRKKISKKKILVKGKISYIANITFRYPHSFYVQILFICVDFPKGSLSDDYYWLFQCRTSGSDFIYRRHFGNESQNSKTKVFLFHFRIFKVRNKNEI